MIDTSDIGETVALLLTYADPEGRNFKKLKVIQKDIAERVMIGPKARRLIRELVEKLDNIECVFVTRSGGCSMPGTGSICSHKELYSGCPKYEQVQPIMRGNPVQGGQ